MPHSGVSVYSIKHELERVLTSFRFFSGASPLVSRDFVKVDQEAEHNGEPYDLLFLTEKAWVWIEAHEDLFVIRRPSNNTTSKIVSDDDVPF